MSTVRRISVLVQEQEVDDGDGFHPLVAIGIARGAGEWRTVRDELVYEVTEGDQSFQVAAGRGGEVLAADVTLADADGLGAGASEAEEV